MQVEISPGKDPEFPCHCDVTVGFVTVSRFEHFDAPAKQATLLVTLFHLGDMLVPLGGTVSTRFNA
jgi:hypothetical protein